MMVEACMKPNLMTDNSDEDEPLVFKRSKSNSLNSVAKYPSTSVRVDKQLGKSGSDGTILDTRKGIMTQSSKPSSSKPLNVMQKHPPPLGKPQKSPQLSLGSQKLSQSSSGPSTSVTISGVVPVKSPYANGASSASHQTKKHSANLVKEEKCLNDELDDSDDDMPISKRIQLGSQKGDSNMVGGKGKHLNGDVEDSDSDSDDHKPLFARLSSGQSKGDTKAGYGGRATGGSLQMQKLKAVSVKSLDDSDDEKPFSTKIKSSIASSSRRGNDIDTSKTFKVQINGSIKREDQSKKVPITSAKRPSAEPSSVQSSNKKVKLSDASPSVAANKLPVKSEAEDSDDDDDHMPIAQRMKAASSSKPVPMKKKVVKVNEKSKKIMKKFKYSRSSKERPNSGNDQKWVTFVHNGVCFPPPYTAHGIKMLYDGKPVVLTPEQEEVATMYAVMLETDYAKREKFNENFFNDWKKLLGKNHVIQDFKKCDFTPIHEWHLNEKEKKKQMSSEEKKALKEEKLKQEEKYMYAFHDGVKEKVGAFRVEPPGLFRGRGEHPKMGKLKRRIYPSDITINISKDAPIPECPIPGQRWKEVRHDNTVTWLAYWIDPINPKEFKYVFLGATSGLKGKTDKEKYEKARKLKDYIEDIRAAYTRDFTSKDMSKRQIAVATYLIDRLALRAGNEKDDDEADTVGCCTLKVENVKPIPPNILEFDFLGKDSIKYYKQFEAEPLAYKAVEQFRKGKSDTDDLFDELDTSKLNAHLKELMPCLTAKVFRTYNASYTLDDMLVKGDVSGEVREKVAVYQHANKEVAVICNHQRAVSKSHSAQMEKLTTRINEAKAELSELEKDLDQAMKGKAPLKDSYGKQKRNLNPEGIEKKILSSQTKIEKYECDMHNKDDLKEVALGTSKLNYLDPRITVAWCKRNEVPIEKVFNKSLLEKFLWAMDVDPSFRF